MTAPIVLERPPTHRIHLPRAATPPLLAEGKVCLPGSVHVQPHGLSNSFGKLLGVHFLLVAVERVAEVWVNKLLVVSEPKHLLLLLLCIVVLAVGCRASSGAADVDYVHQDIAAVQTRVLCAAAKLHGAGDLRPSVFCVTFVKETLVSFGLHCWLIDSP